MCYLSKLPSLYDDINMTKGVLIMVGYVLANFLIYAGVNAFTPGPGNILALNTVTNYGWGKGKPLFFGIFAGYYVVQIICALFVYGVGAFLPDALQVMKYIGAAYILWLAVHIAAGRPEISEDQGSASFLKGFLLQFVNIKIYMFGITALTGFITPYSTALWILVAVEILIATLGDHGYIHLDRRWTADPEILHQPLPDHQYSSGTDPAGMHMEHTGPVKLWTRP